MQKAAVDQHELDAEDDACYHARPHRAVAVEEPDSTQPPDDQQHRQRANGAGQRLEHRRHVRQHQLDGDLIETPADAQHQHQGDGARGKRAPGGGNHLAGH